jgi:hypothetical protein
MRATHAGQIVGTALESSDGIASGSYGSVLVYVNVSYWAPSPAAAIADMPLTLESQQPGLMALIVDAFKSILNITFDNGLIRTIKGVFTEVQTDKLCVGSTCVDEQQLQELLKAQGMTPSSGAAPTPSTTASSSAPTPLVIDTTSPAVTASGSASPTPDTTTLSPSPSITPTPSDTPSPTVEAPTATPVPTSTDMPSPLATP